MRVPINRLRPSTTGVALVVALVSLFLVLSTDNPVSQVVRAEPTYQATALTAGRTDINLRVPRTNLTADPFTYKPGRPDRVVTALPAGESVPAAPLIGWYNKSFAKGLVQRWCLAGDPTLQDVLRGLLNELSAAFPDNFRWVEDCVQPTYWAGEETAGRDCGSPSALACAAYLGEISCRTSHNPSYTTGRANRVQLLRVLYAHELQHCLDLDHTPCGVNLDPATGQPVASVMTPIDLDGGRSCSEPPAYGLAPSDWFHLYAEYHIPGGPRASPAPSPAPPPSPTPPPPVQSAWEYWVPARAGRCPAGYTAWDDWCVALGSALPWYPEWGPGWRHRVEVKPDGSVHWVSDWEAAP